MCKGRRVAIANMAPMPGSPVYDRARLYGRRW